MTLAVTTCIVSHFEQNARVVCNQDDNTAMIIDPGGSEQVLFDLVRDKTVELIVLTHCHIDHAGAAKRLLVLFDQANLPRPKVAYHSKEIIVGEHIETYGQMYGFSASDYENAPEPDLLLDDRDTVSLGSAEFRVLFTPGHAPGHVALYYEPDSFSLAGEFSEALDCRHLLIAGDALFSGSIGRTDLPLGNHGQLIESIKTQLLTLPDDTLVCSGHGPNTTIRTERESNAFLI